MDETDKIEPIRCAIRNSALKLMAAERILALDAAIGALYASIDLAGQAGMATHAAIEWIRTAADLMERQLFEAASHV